MDNIGKGATPSAPAPEQAAPNGEVRAAASPANPPTTPENAPAPSHDWEKRYKDSQGEFQRKLETMVDVVIETPQALASLAKKDPAYAEMVAKRLTIDGKPASNLEEALKAIGSKPAAVSSPESEDETLAKLEKRQQQRAALSSAEKAIAELPENIREDAKKKWEARLDGRWGAERVADELDILLGWAKSKAPQANRKDEAIANMAASANGVNGNSNAIPKATENLAKRLGIKLG